VAVKHVVLLKFRKDTSPEKIKDLFTWLGNLRQHMRGILDFSAGAYSSPEGLNRGYTHGFVMTFADAASRDLYLPDPAHKKIVDLLLPELEGGVSGVLAFDWEYNPLQ
jgi:hypothetical protein